MVLDFLFGVAFVLNESNVTIILVLIYGLGSVLLLQDSHGWQALWKGHSCSSSYLTMERYIEPSSGSLLLPPR